MLYTFLRIFSRLETNPVNTKQHRQRRRFQFTLVEIMVALGMLMLMMSFLFVFVIGSQRLWNASEHQGQLFDDGQLVMDIVGDDLRNLAFSLEVGQARPFYRKVYSGANTIEVEGQNVKGAQVYVFFSNFTSGVDSYHIGCYPIIYIYVPEQIVATGDSDLVKARKSRVSWSLYRLPLEGAEAGVVTDAALKKLWETQEIDFTKAVNNTDNNNAFEDFVEDGIEKITLTRDHLLMRNVSQFDITADKLYSDANFYKNDFIVEYPKMFQIQLGMFSRNAINENEWEDTTSGGADRQALITNHERVFTKSIQVE